MTSTFRAALLAPLALLVALPSFAQPRAVLTEPIKDFQTVAKGEVIRHDFEIRNEGDAPLEIIDVRPACGCTVADYTSTIPAGESGKVHAEVETVTFAGPIAKSIAVFTNDPEQPQLQLVVKAMVKPYIAVDPGYARFIYVQREPHGTVTQSIFAEDDQDFDILGIDYPEDVLRAEAREAEPEEKVRTAARQWKVDLSIREDASVGPLRDFVTITTDHPKQKEIKIPISGFVRPRQHLTPYELDLGRLDSESLPYERRLDLTSFITDEIEIEKVVSPVEGIEAEVTANESRPDLPGHRSRMASPGHRFEVTVRFGPELPKGELDTELEIHISDPENPIVKLPIRGEVL